MINTITVITVFIGFIFRLKVPSEHAVATAGGRAIGETGIIVEPVSVVAGFPGLEDSIATANGAAVVAAIIAGLIAIIAAFTGTDDPVAADVFLAVVFTSVFVSVVAIITGFKPRAACVEILSSQAITTAGSAALVGARVLIVLVAVVTVFLVLVSEAVTAACWLTGIETVIVLGGVAIIAGLEAFVSFTEIVSSDPVTTTGKLAFIGAAISGFEVAVVTIFVAGIT